MELVHCEKCDGVGFIMSGPNEGDKCPICKGLGSVVVRKKRSEDNEAGKEGEEDKGEEGQRG